MANRRYDESQDDQRNRARYERDGGGRDEHTTPWRPRAYDQPHVREDAAETRFRAGSQWDQDRRDYVRAPGRAHDDYGSQDYGQQDYGHAFGFARHERRYDEDGRNWRDEARRDREAAGSFRESAGYPPYVAGFPPRSYDPGIYSAFQGQGRDEPAERGFRGHGPKDYKRSDERIRDDVCDRLADADAVDARGISVDVANGEVTLSGQVSSRYAKRAAEDTVEQCSGIRHVQNNLRIRDTGDETGATSASGVDS
ncbi:BON domain-containing protein [Rhodobacter sp. 24-YEA-8]|uniref:BON domain-containing protein n=1 Tax=Rhodobacter sp. 24-YEA-8 TaxID=1884310 RepID=UPI00089D1112|nr:BON domain-containing protein [Rhodobacter sp. 24-YEA-8]SED49949.1 BON domain-containing protein [Rhodobacter sp. 24-YEA-8]